MNATLTAPALPAAASATRSGYGAGWWRDLLIPLAVFSLTRVLPFHSIVLLYTVMGQAHFTHAYIYQRRAGKMDARYLAIAALLFVSGVLYFILGVGTTPLLVLIGALFSAHFAYDEIQLHDEKPQAGSILTVGAFAVFFESLVFAFVAPVSFHLVPYFGLGFLALATLARAFFGGKPTKAERYLWYVELLTLFFVFVLHTVGAMLAIIVILHGTNWYVGYGMKVRNRPERARTYWMEAAVLLAGTAALFVWFASYGAHFLKPFFGIAEYYAWATAHIVLSFMATLAGKRS